MVLRPAALGDSDTLRAWRNDPTTVRYSKSRVAVTEEEHRVWLASRLDDEEPRIWIAVVDGVSVGEVRLDPIGRGYEIDVAVAPSERGRGLGTAIVSTLVREAASAQLTPITAIVHTDNVASLRVFARAGFRITATRSDWVTLEWATA